MKQHRIQSILLCLLSVLLLTGCWQEDVPDSPSLLGEEELSPVEPRVILPEHFSLPYDPGQTLDPLLCPDGMQQVVASLLYEGLFRLSPTFEPELWLCSGYTCDEAALTYVFTLRPDAVFSDGTPLLPSDVEASLDRARTSERYAARLGCIQSVTADETAVTVTLTAPHTALPTLLDVPIIKAGTEQNPVPTGSGPYLFSAESSGAWLIANQTWWRSDYQPTDRIALVEATDQDSKLYRFTTHDVQLITADLTGTDPIRATGNVSYQDADTTILQYLGCNTARAPLDNAALRQALSAGIHRDHITEAFLSGHGVSAQFPISPLSELYPADLEQEYAPDLCAAAVAASGYVPQRTLSLLVNEENSFKTSIARHLAETFTAAGVPTEARVLPWADYTAALAAGDFDLYYGEVRLTADWDPSTLLATGAPLNYGLWSSQQADHLLASFRSAADRPTAARTLCTYLQLHAPILPICFKSSSVLMQTNVLSNLTSTMTHPFYNLESCTIHLQIPK